MTKKYDITIIGAGISGLSLAHFCLKKGMNVLVLESSGRAGGAFNSYRLKGKGSENFWIEMGAHTCYNSYTKLLSIIEDCGLLTSLIPREKVPFRIFHGGKIKSIVSQVNFFELLISLPKLLSANKEGKSVKEYYSNILGKRNFNNLFNYFFNAVPSQESSDFPADILFKKRSRRKDIVRSYTFKNGLQSIIDAIIQEQDIDIICDQQVVKLKMDEDQYTLITKQGEAYPSKYIGLATSARQAAGILAGQIGKLAEELEKISAKSIETVGVVVNKEDLQLEKLAGIIPIKGDFFSAVSRDTVVDENYRGFTFHFKPGVLSKDEKLKNIEEVLGIRKNQIKDLIMCKNLVTSPSMGHHQIIGKIDSLIKDKNILITGNYFKGVSIEDCVNRSSEELMRMKL